MIRGVCGHVWEGPGQSAIVLQLNLDKHEEIFSLPSSQFSSSRKLKQKPDKSTPIVVRVSISAPSFDEMPQSLQMWQTKGTDEKSMAENGLVFRPENFN